MTISRGTWVKQNGTAGVTAVEARRAQGGQFYQSSAGVVRTGLLSKDSTFNLVTGTAGLYYQIAAFPAFVIGRAANEGCYVLTGQGTTNTANVAAAPAAGLSRWDLIWIKQNDIEKGDADNLPVIGVAQGTAAASPAKPEASVPAGAVVLAEARIYSGTTGTSGGANTITQRWRYTAMVGDPVPVRNLTERAEMTTPKPGDTIARFDLEFKGLALEDWSGSAWLPKQRPIKNVVGGVFVGNGTGLAAKVASGEVQLVHQVGTHVTATDASGYIAVSYPEAFPNGVISAQVTNGDSGTGRSDSYAVAGAPFTNSVSTLYVSISTNGGSPRASSTVRCNYDVWGW